MASRLEINDCLLRYLPELTIGDEASRGHQIELPLNALHRCADRALRYFLAGVGFNAT
jgi:hypothetical protein